MSDTTTTDAKRVTVTIERFTSPRAGGTSVEAIAHDGDYFPTVFVFDSGDVELTDDGFHMDADAAVEWLRAVADHIEARRDAS